MPTTRNNDHEIFALVATMLQNFEGREFSGEIRRDTLFFADLGFASIDAIVLGEQLEIQLGRPISFASFLAELSTSNAQDISVGKLVEFLARE